RNNNAFSRLSASRPTTHQAKTLRDRSQSPRASTCRSARGHALADAGCVFAISNSSARNVDVGGALPRGDWRVSGADLHHQLAATLSEELVQHPPVVSEVVGFEV